MVIFHWPMGCVRASQAAWYPTFEINEETQVFYVSKLNE